MSIRVNINGFVLTQSSQFLIHDSFSFFRPNYKISQNININRGVDININIEKFITHTYFKNINNLTSLHKVAKLFLFFLLLGVIL